MASRTILSTFTRVSGALVVISPATVQWSVVTSVSQATRLIGSWDRQKSRTASETWSATLSGWPIDTDSLVNRYRPDTAGPRAGQAGEFVTEPALYTDRPPVGQTVTVPRKKQPAADPPAGTGGRRLALARG